MKKVRYAVGVLGIVPALGLAAPAAAAAPRMSASTGKTVTLIPNTTAPCDARKTPSGTQSFTASIHYSRDIGCIGKVYGSLFHHSSAGWWMRVRSYDDGILVRSKMNKKGHTNIFNNSITWSSAPRTTGIQQVCEAIVSSNNPTIPRFGTPVCEQTGFS